jgi:hypothetical protein
MKNLISYSLWGDNPMYWKGALRNIEQAKNYFPGWICRFYIDKNCKPELIETISGENVEVILIESKDSFHGMFWRFFASEDEEVDVFLSRDCDSRFSERELLAINEWLISDKDFHIMRDHPYHNVPILGGMWGCRRGIMREIGLSKLIEKWNQFQRKGIDQDFLGYCIYPLIRNRALEHSEFGLRFGGDVKIFPSSRINSEFVGDVFNENDIRHPDYWRIIEECENKKIII